MAFVTSDDTAARLRRVRREPPAFRRVQVRSKKALSERMLRIVLGGGELDGFAIESPASSVRLLLPPAGGDVIEMPTWTGNQFELASGERAPIRTFTPRAFDAERLELTIDVVLHDHGVATDWARRAELGNEVAISGPGRSEKLDPAARSFLLAGDESAIPAISQLLESIAPDRTIDVHIEISDPRGAFRAAQPPRGRDHVARRRRRSRPRRFVRRGGGGTRRAARRHLGRRRGRCSPAASHSLVRRARTYSNERHRPRVLEAGPLGRLTWAQITTTPALRGPSGVGRTG